MAAKNSTLSFGLVSIEVQIHNATNAAERDVKLDSASPEGNPVAQVYRDKVTGEVIENRSDLKKGKFEGDSFHEIPKDKLDEIADATKLRSLELDFEPLDNVPMERLTGLYSVTAKEGYEDKLAMLTAAMEAEGVAFVSKWVPVSRQSLVVGFVKDGALCLAQLPYANQRSELKPITGKAPSAKELKLARQLIKASSGQKLLAEARDEGVDQKKEAVKAAISGKPIKTAPKNEPTKDQNDILAALEASLAAS